MRKTKGPNGYLQWQEAVKLPLTVEHSQTLAYGGCKVKSQYPHVFNLISDYVTGNFNEYAKSVANVAGGVEDVFALREFSAKLKRIFFYKKLKFISATDSRRLTAALTEAISDILNKLKDVTDVDLLYEMGVIKRIYITEAL